MRQVAGNVEFDRQSIADHANQLAANIKGNLARSLEAIGVVCPPHPSLLNSPLHLSEPAAACAKWLHGPFSHSRGCMLLVNASPHIALPAHAIRVVSLDSTFAGMHDNVCISCWRAGTGCALHDCECMHSSKSRISVEAHGLMPSGAMPGCNLSFVSASWITHFVNFDLWRPALLGCCCPRDRKRSRSALAMGKPVWVRPGQFIPSAGL